MFHLQNTHPGLIFDAERRWAPAIAAITGTAGMAGLIFDAERRWAPLVYAADKGFTDLDWSLMPKGVEHKQITLLITDKQPGLIFDAERRWARKHQNLCSVWWSTGLIFDAERRWAQIYKARGTKPIYAGLIFDAERRWAPDYAGLHHRPLTLDWSLMPKGVEHTNMTPWNSWTGQLDWSLMPKGVEHQNDYSAWKKNVEWIDLWCRKALST